MSVSLSVLYALTPYPPAICLPRPQGDCLAKLKMDWKNALTRNELGASSDKCPCPRQLGVVSMQHF